ncbi:hypothetical protein ALI144C_36165 [Actinosynnema sp. ALI-1.44]|uniref:alpha-N-acetylglucosaminidase n=1 Tax=Actinosynnema sp. ALI-1.44 TaxID=1933779 RepID=UPI00097BF4E8|nr:alpha-N-acetylglucosaminidase [Actinosynnema sp. ALI-1.44]ONI76125.1 hypothetical protein ALI144C_36165 [Actinosynnema sp. ALI-1.44]
MRAFPRRSFLTGSLAAAFLAGTRPSTASAEADIPAARAAIGRLLGRDTSQFVLKNLDLGDGEVDAFEISGQRGRVVLAGSSTVALVSGMHWWLKYVAGGHISANGDQLDLPASLPAPAQPIRMSTELAERYAYNFTVFGYTSPFWTWSEWERELDYLAASGMNRALALIGQEIVWYDTFRDFGLTELEVRQWIAQPAHQPWQWYGEITGYDEDASAYSGPVTLELLANRRDLGKRIVDRMRELGITPVFPAFVGHVPDQMFADRHPGTHIPAQGDYVGHPRPYWLDTTEALYPEVAQRFYAAQKEHFGVTTHYSNDLFHENDVDSSLDGADLFDVARAVQDELDRAAPGAIWIMQGWLGNPDKRILDAVDENRIIVLDLASDDDRQWEETEAYWGVPWCWGTIQNYGGRLGMFGNVIEPGRTLPEVRERDDRRRLVGTAMVLEGIHHNPVVPDLLSEMAWRHDSVEMEPWILGYAKRRYGADDAHAANAWRILLNTAYNYTSTHHETGDGPFETPFAAEPRLPLTWVSRPGPDTWRYDPKDFAPCLDELLAVAPAIRARPTYRYDLVDVTRQVLSNRGRLVLDKIEAAYKAKNSTELRKQSDRFLTAIDLTEKILATHDQWLLGTWLEQAKSWASSDEERGILEWNARSIVTIWSIDAAAELHEYANRDWHGLLGGYYKPRWQRFLDALPGTMQTGKPPEFDDWATRGDAWCLRNDIHPSKGVGDPYTIASQIAAELRADPV